MNCRPSPLDGSAGRRSPSSARLRLPEVVAPRTPESSRAVAECLDMAQAGLTPSHALQALGLTWTEPGAPSWSGVALLYGFDLERRAMSASLKA